MQQYKMWLAAAIVSASSSWSAVAMAEDAGITGFEQGSINACVGKNEGDHCYFDSEDGNYRHEGSCMEGRCMGRTFPLGPIPGSDAGTPVNQDASVTASGDADVVTPTTNGDSGKSSGCSVSAAQAPRISSLLSAIALMSLIALRRRQARG